MTDNSIFLSYEAHVLYRVIGVDRDKFNQWKKHLDIDPKRSRFTEGDFLAYWVMFWLCGHCQHPLPKLSQQPAWKKIFDACYNMPRSSLKKCAIACSWSDRKLYFLKDGQKPKGAIEAYHYIGFQRILQSYDEGNEKYRGRPGDLKSVKRKKKAA